MTANSQERYGGLDPKRVEAIAEACGNCATCGLRFGYFATSIDVMASIHNRRNEDGELVKVYAHAEPGDFSETVCVHPERHEAFLSKIAELGVTIEPIQPVFEHEL